MTFREGSVEANLDEADASFRSQRTLDENVTVVVDPSFGRENVVNTHLTFVPNDRFVEFRKDQHVQRLRKDFYK